MAPLTQHSVLDLTEVFKFVEIKSFEHLHFRCLKHDPVCGKYLSMQLYLEVQLFVVVSVSISMHKLMI